MLFAFSIFAKAAEIQTASCRIVNGNYQIISGIDKTYSAWATWEDSISEVGWYQFHVETNEDSTSSDQFKCAGALDGYLGQHRIYQRFNLYKDQMNLPRNETFPEQWESWMQLNLDYTRNQVSSNQNDTYWVSMGLILDQFDGLVAGYQSAAPQTEYLRMMDLLFIQAIGDIYDLESYWSPGYYNELHHMECSGLVAMTEGYKDLFFGQAAWSSFQKMHQVLKEYNIKAKEHPNKHVIISTRMGALASSDDFWVNDAGLMILETTNNNYNSSLYQLITEKSVLTWLRTLHATWFSTKAEQWTQEFIRENSGTYNNQYVVVDTKQFVPGEKPEKDLIWVIEQLPGMYRSADATELLASRRWFPSINTPWFEDIFEISGYPEKIKEKGDLGDYYSYYNSSRYLIFNMEAPKIKNFSDFQKLMRRNEFISDNLTHNIGHGDPAQQILSRYDLRHQYPTPYGAENYFGGLDTKTASAIHILHNLSFEAIGCPKYSETIPPWEFGVAPFENVKYDGLPKKWNFSWINYSADSYDRCAQYKDQDSCTAVERCGWCLYESKCFLGQKDGPLEDKCDSGWIYPTPLPSWALPVIISVSVIVVVFVLAIYIMAWRCDPTKKKQAYDQI